MKILFTLFMVLILSNNSDAQYTVKSQKIFDFSSNEFYITYDNAAGYTSFKIPTSIRINNDIKKIIIDNDRHNLVLDYYNTWAKDEAIYYECTIDGEKVRAMLNTKDMNFAVFLSKGEKHLYKLQ